MDIDPKGQTPKDDDDFENLGEITNEEKEQLKMKATDGADLVDVVDEEADIARAKAFFEKSSNVDIKVHNPVERKGGAFSKNYHVYEVVGNDKNGEIKVFRRFSEFEALRKKLKENWPGIFIPAIPEKTVKSSDSKVVLERTLCLDHFVRKCARIDHIYYSEEMQIFLRSTGSSDEVIKNLANFPVRSCATIYNQYRILFPDFDQPCPKDKEEQIIKKVNSLKSIQAEVKVMRDQLKIMDFYRKDMKILKSELTKYIAKECISKLKEGQELESIKDQVKEYEEVEKADDITVLNKNLKVLKRDLESFFTLTNDLSFIYRIIGHSNSIIADTTKELAKLKSLDTETVSDGIFKKVNRTDKIRNQERIQSSAKEELDAAFKLKDLVFNMVEHQELPLLIYVKNQGFANGFAELAKRRRECLEREERVLKQLVDAVPLAAK